MQIDMLAGNTVKITLLKSDMLQFNISYDDISGKSQETKLALSKLISAIGEENRLDLTGERLLVEAFPSKEGGCMLYISCLGKGSNIRGLKKQPGKTDRENILSESENLEDIISLCCLLYEKYPSLSSRLYFCECKSLYGNITLYRLVVSAPSLSPCIKAVIGEFSDIKPYNYGIVSETEEFFRLVSDDAIREMQMLR